MANDGEDLFSSVNPSRRSFIKKMVAAAFIAPVISSFPLSALASAQTQKAPSHHHPNGDRDEDHDKDKKEDDD
jgi:hypothetical protein